MHSPSPSGSQPKQPSSIYIRHKSIYPSIVCVVVLASKPNVALDTELHLDRAGDRQTKTIKLKWLGPRQTTKWRRVCWLLFFCVFGVPQNCAAPHFQCGFHVPFPPTVVEAYANNLAQKLSRKSSQSGRAAELVRDNQLMYAIYACLIQLNCFWVE